MPRSKPPRSTRLFVGFDTSHVCVACLARAPSGVYDTGTHPPHVRAVWSRLYRRRRRCRRHPHLRVQHLEQELGQRLDRTGEPHRMVNAPVPEPAAAA